MANTKRLLWEIVVLAAVIFCSVSCDTDNDSPEEKTKTRDYSGLLAEYADKVTVPAPGDIPAFTADMGIPVRDSVEAEIIYDAMLKGSSGDSIFFGLGFPDNIGSGNERRSENFTHDDFYIFEYVYSERYPGDFMVSSKQKFDTDMDYLYSGITIYAGSLTNYWYLLHRGANWENDPWGNDTFVVDRSANGYTVSQGGFCAKVIVNFTYFSYGDYRGVGTVKVYGAEDKELLAKKLTKKSDFKDFLYVD